MAPEGHPPDTPPASILNGYVLRGVRFENPPQAAVTDSQSPSRFSAVARTAPHLLADNLQTVRGKLFPQRPPLRGLVEELFAMAEYLLKTGEAGTVVPEQDKVAFHDRHEFADVPRPGIAPDGIQNGRGDNGGVFPIPFEDVGDEERHVFQTIPQGGDFKADARQTEIQIQPERAHLDQIQQLLVRGADDPHVDGNEAIAPLRA